MHTRTLTRRLGKPGFFFILAAMALGAPANAADPVARQLCVQNGGGFIMKTGVIRDGENRPYYFAYGHANPNTKCIDRGAQAGNSQRCRPVADIVWGKDDYTADDNQSFIFQPGGQGTITYTITGTTYHPKWHRQSTD